MNIYCANKSKRLANVNRKHTKIIRHQKFISNNINSLYFESKNISVALLRVFLVSCFYFFFSFGCHYIHYLQNYSIISRNRGRTHTVYPINDSYCYYAL